MVGRAPSPLVLRPCLTFCLPTLHRRVSLSFAAREEGTRREWWMCQGSAAQAHLGKWDGAVPVDRQTVRQTDRWAHRHRHTDTNKHSQTDTQTERQVGR